MPSIFMVVYVVALLGRFKGQVADAPTAAQGRRIVRASCQTCHSLSPGEVKVGPSLWGVLNGAHPRATELQVEDIVKNGRNKMPAYGSVFSEQERKSIALYLRQLP